MIFLKRIENPEENLGIKNLLYSMSKKSDDMFQEEDKDNKNNKERRAIEKDFYNSQEDTNDDSYNFQNTNGTDNINSIFD